MHTIHYHVILCFQFHISIHCSFQLFGWHFYVTYNHQHLIYIVISQVF